MTRPGGRRGRGPRHRAGFGRLNGRGRSGALQTIGGDPGPGSVDIHVRHHRDHQGSGRTGVRSVLDILVEGLARLEYRGYDSAGLALVGPAEDGMWRVRAANGTRSLDDLIKRTESAPPIRRPASDTPGGPPTDARTKATPTPTPTAPAAWPWSTTASSRTTWSCPTAHRRRPPAGIGDRHRGAGPSDRGPSRRPPRRRSGRRRAGRPGPGAGRLPLAVVHADDPDAIVAARRVSPLIMGVTDGASFLASDIPAILGLTHDFFILDDDRVAELRPGSISVTTLEGEPVEPAPLHVDWDLDAARKDGFDDFMSKEMHEQSKAVADTLLDRVLPDGTLVLDEVHLTNEEFRAITKVFVVACGSSYHAGLMAKYAIEHWARLPVEIDIATNSGTATRWSTSTPWSSGSASRVRRSTRSRPSGKPRSWGPRCW